MMEVILSGRKTGRTQHLINLASEAEKRGECSYIVCGTHQQAFDIAKRAREQGLHIGFPLTYHEFLTNHYYQPNIRNFFIDNVDHMLQQMCGGKIMAVTIEKREDETTP